MKRCSFKISAKQRPYQPYGAAKKIMHCREPEILMEGPAGTGKTRALLEKANLCALKYPGMRALLLRKTRESLTESVLVTFENKVIPADWSVLLGPSRKHRHSYDYPNRSEIIIGGIDRASKIMSTEYDMIFVFEAREISEHDWESLLSRLRNNVMPYQQAIADTNPDAPTHWLNRRAEAGQIERLRSRHKDNPSIQKAYLARLEKLTGVRSQRLYHGRWAGVEGSVYQDWDPDRHLIPWFEIPRSWRRIRSVDFGYTHPFVCQWWAIDPDGRLYLYREIYLTGKLVEDHAKKIIELTGDEVIEATITDHDAEDRATLERHGIASIRAFKSISQGIQAVTSRLRLCGDKKPRLFLLENVLVECDPRLSEQRLPTCTQQEFDSYVWPMAGMSQMAHHDEKPVDMNNHGMDAMRYTVAHIDHLGQSPFSFKVLH